MTSQGTAHGRFTRAIQQRNLWAAETSLRELGSVSLEDELGYLDLPPSESIGATSATAPTTAKRTIS